LKREFNVSSESVSGTDPGGLATKKLNEFDKSLMLLISQSRKLHDRIGRSLNLMKKGVSPKELDKLLVELGNMQVTAQIPSVSALIQELQIELPKIKRAFASSFNSELKRLCEASSLAYRQHGDELAVGPCIVAVDAVKEKVELSYAKFVFGRPAIQAEAVLDEIIEFKKSTLDRAVDLKKTRAILDEAVRVSMARKSKPAKGSIRIELPTMFREIKFIKEQGTSSKLSEEFSLPRFVVEIATLLKSDENLNSTCSYSLETAVLENTNDPRKSVFIPKDLYSGHGDGTYYQALIQCLG
jgi:hypothetical protein